MNQARYHLLSAALMALGLSALPASAAIWSKTSTATNGSTASTCNTVSGSSCTIANAAADASNATVSAWASTGSGGLWAAATLSNQLSSGFGVTAAGESTSAPNHGVDNAGNREAVLYKFDKKTELDSVTVGWWSRDLDITVLRYTGSGGPTMGSWGISGTNSVVGSMAGWELVGSYGRAAYGSESSTSAANCGTSGANSAACNVTINVNALNYSSSYWLVMAYNSAVGGAAGGVLSNGNDYFKLLSVVGSTSKVSEPGALALASLALFGVAYSRRRRA
jgi:hypothetical protein